ncbi:MAG: MutS-related protein [Clostridium sp.]|uniref:MutS-related protein n=1 Tax=Clostridium sp. TaxID=1506 RepID=UPI003F3EF120
MNALKFYEKNIQESEIEIKKIDKKSLAIGWSRLLIVVFLIFSVYKFYSSGKETLAIISGGFFVIVFILVALLHNNILKKKKSHELMIEINKKGIRRLNGEFKNEEDCGKEYIDEKHPYTNDLDIFGVNSLFQLINTTVTKGGREVLFKILSENTTKNVNEIKKKQEGIKELGKKVSWRQKLILKGLMNIQNSDQELNEIEYLKTWSRERKSKAKYKKYIAYFFILLTFGWIALSFAGFLRWTDIIIILMINFVVIKSLTKDSKSDLEMFAAMKPTIKAYAEMLEVIEDESFESEYLRDIRNKINNENKNISCKKEMKKLASILDWVGDSHGNAYYLIINLFIFSDVFLVSNLESFREKNGEYLNEWLEAMSEFDALGSVANLAFDFEAWTYPEIVDEKIVKGKQIGHPILGERAIRNDYELDRNTKTTLITGSNMSGKSTFLRTVGLNLVLSYLGAPVNSDEFKCGMFDLYTCMRTKDNLEESTSSFYAEILRIKLLIEGAKSGKRIFFLLDEIFKGTNSADRHTGAKVLINQLIDSGAVGLVSTHDLELCDLEESDKRIQNKNFREYYEDGKIKFDYKLRDGKSRTQNAIHLMKLAGIDFNEKE